MSSPGYPTLNLDVSARRGESVVATVTLVLVAVAVLLLWLQQSTLVGIAALGALIVAGFGFRHIGWLGGGRRTSRIACQADGRWLVTDSQGRHTECRLAPGSRVTPHGLWLQWLERDRPPLLLLSGDVSTDDFRRLVTHLRLSRPLNLEGIDRAA